MEGNKVIRKVNNYNWDSILQVAYLFRTWAVLHHANLVWIGKVHIIFDVLFVFDV